MKQLILVGLLAFPMPLMAQIPALVGTGALSPASFPVDVELQGEGLDLTTSTGNVGNVATVTLTNLGETEVFCVATFTNGPERPSPVRARLTSGEKTVLTQAFSREIVRVRVAIECNED